MINPDALEAGPYPKNVSVREASGSPERGYRA